MKIRALKPAAALVALMSMTAPWGCLYVAPIEEETAEDSLPFINHFSDVSPSIGLVKVTLSNGGAQTFSIPKYGDLNEEQPLYYRVVMDYRPSGASGSFYPVASMQPVTIEPGARNAIEFTYPACEYAKNFPNTIGEGKMINIYFLLSDRPFVHQNQYFQSSDFSQPFMTQKGDKEDQSNAEYRVVWVEWTLEFLGVCNSPI